MIVYSPFWETLKKSNESWYSLTKTHHMSNNRDVSTRTLNDLCRILGCRIEDIALFVPSDSDQKL